MSLKQFNNKIHPCIQYTIQACQTIYFNTCGENNNFTYKINASERLKETADHAAAEIN